MQLFRVFSRCSCNNTYSGIAENKVAAFGRQLVTLNSKSHNIMIGGKWLLGSLLIIVSLSAPAQKIVYSDYDKDDTRRLNFEVAGKIGGNFLIYKNIRNKSWISVLNN